MKTYSFFRAMLMVLLLPLCGLGQANNGIYFEKNLNWKQIQAKAKAEHKYIFMDCMATWCAPCRQMEQTIFPQKDVGDFFNQHFINVEVQLDKTDNDGGNVRDWYNDAAQIKQNYHINAYPTFLYFDPSGRLVHKAVGATIRLSEFIIQAKEALDPSTQYYTLLANYKDHLQDQTYLHKLITSGLRLQDDKAVRELAEQLTKLKNPLNLINIDFIKRYGLLNNNNALALMFITNARQIDSITANPAYVEDALSDLIFKETIEPLLKEKQAKISWRAIATSLKTKYPTLNSNMVFIEHDRLGEEIRSEIKQLLPKDSIADWNMITRTMKERYPDFNFEMQLLATKSINYSDHNQHVTANQLLFELLNKYRKDMPVYQINSFIYYEILPYCANPEILTAATAWINEIVIKQDFKDGAYLDTYANMLYKTGQVNDAVLLEEKALALVHSERSIKELNLNLSKMRNRQPTWLDNTPVVK